MPHLETFTRTRSFVGQTGKYYIQVDYQYSDRGRGRRHTTLWNYGPRHGINLGHEGDFCVQNVRQQSSREDFQGAPSESVVEKVVHKCVPEPLSVNTLMSKLVVASFHCTRSRNS